VAAGAAAGVAGAAGAGVAAPAVAGAECSIFSSTSSG